MEAPRQGTTGFRRDLARMRDYLEVRHPLYHRAFDLLLAQIDRGLDEAFERAWRGRGFRAFYERPLLVLAVLRFEALRAGPGHPLHGALVAADPAALTPGALARALAPEREQTWARLADREVQTNDTSRAVTWMWPARLVAAGRPLALIDLGASAGLNLVADRLEAPWIRPDGTPLPVVEHPAIRLRWGLDRRPVDLGDPEAVDWLRACVWAGQSDRLERLEASLDAYHRLRGGPSPVQVHRGDLGSCGPLLERAADAAGEGAVLLAFQSVVRAYLDDETASAFDETVHGWLGRHERAVHLELEAGPEGSEGVERPAAVYATVAGPGGIERRVVARCEYHPVEVAVDDGGARRLQRWGRP